MIGHSMWEDAFFVITGLTSFAVVVRFLSWVYQGRLSNGLASLMALVRAWVSGSAETDEVTLLVQARLLEKKVNQFRLALQLVAYLILPFSIGVVHRRMAGMGKITTTAQEVCIVLTQLHSVLVHAWPGCVSLQSLDIHYSFSMLILAMVVSPCTVNPSMVLETVVIANSLLVLLDSSRRTMARRVPVFCICNIFFAACTSAAIKMHWTEGVKESIAILQLIVVAVIAGGAALTEDSFRKAMYQTVRLQAVSELHAAAVTLLRSCCEVVVELDSRGIITSSGTDLGSFLLRGGRDQCLRGVALVDLLAEEEDRTRFLEELSESKLRGTGLAENMPVTMKDCCNNKLRLELLWFQFNRLDGKYFMVGIREFSDRPRVSQRQTPLVGEMTDQPCLGMSSETEDTFEEVPFAPTLSWSESPGSSCSFSSAGFQRCVRLAEDVAAVATVDCSAEGYPIQNLTAGFVAQIGNLPMQTPIVKFVRKPEDLSAWVQDSLNAIAQGAETHEHKLVFKLPHGRFQAYCSVMTPAEGGEAISRRPHLDHVRLLFSGVCRTRSSTSSGRLEWQSHLQGTPSFGVSSMTDALKMSI